MTAAIKHPCDEGSILGGLVDVPCDERTGAWVLAATILGSSMVFLDGTVVNVSLPAIQSSLGASASEVQWILESYALFLAALLLVGGSLGDQFGRARVFAIGIIVFTAASLWCGLAPDARHLIIARGVQGVGGALLVPGSLALISASFDEKQRGRAIGTWSGTTAITMAAGPLLGGWLADHGAWRWTFFLNVPFALAVLAIVILRVPESRGRHVDRIDWIGASLATIGLAGVVYGLIEAPATGWTHLSVIVSIGLGVAILATFVVHESRAKSPMVPLQLFRSRSFSGANLLTLFLYAGLTGALFILPFTLIRIHGYTATGAGAGILPFILIMFALSRWSGGLIVRYGARVPLIVGPLIAGAGFLLLSLPGVAAGSYWSSFFPGVVVLGIGMAISVAPLTTVVMGSVASEFAGTASGINNAVSRVASLVAVAVMGVVLLSVYQVRFEARLDEARVPDAVRAELGAKQAQFGKVEVPPNAVPAVAAAIEEASARSFIDGYRACQLLSAGLGVLAACCAALLIDGKQKGKRSRT